MTDDSLTVAGQSHLTDAFLWLVGAPLCLLDALYLSHLAPPLSAERPETLILWVLGIAALALLAWSLLCSACAHLALLRPRRALLHVSSSPVAAPVSLALC